MRLILVALLCLVAIGCRSNPRRARETALLRSEILDLEDKYYLLKSKYDGVMSQIGEGQIIGEAYYEDAIIYEGDEWNYEGGIEPGEAEPSPADPNGVTPREYSSNTETNAGVRSMVQPPGQTSRTPNSQVPQSQVNAPQNAEPLPSPNSESDQSNLMLNPPGTAGSSDIEIKFPRVISDEPYITEILINPQTTRGRDVDGVSGDEGIDLMIQPKTANGQVEFQAGELTISVIDPTETHDRQRIGLWKFLPHETKLFFAIDEQGSRGILLHLPWEQSTPVHEKLVLHVRFVTPDGRKLETTGDLRITPPAPGYSAKDSVVAAWTRHDPRWIPEPDPHTTGDSLNWRQRSTSPGIRAANGPARNTQQPTQRTIPAKAEIKRPTWRPIR